MKITDCDLCNLRHKRTNVVAGTGSDESGIMIIGEAPGYHEDLSGIPFYGLSGKLLRESIELFYEGKIEDIYITNVVKCRPTTENGKNRKPTQIEIDTCGPWLNSEIIIIKPSIIITLGKTAFDYMFIDDEEKELKNCRGRVNWSTRYKHWVYPMYHPSYILRASIQSEFKDNCLKLGHMLHAPWREVDLFLKGIKFC